MLKNKTESIKIASTEAGSIPFYSKIFTVDLFGLNSKQFSKKPAGGEYLIKNFFDVIIISTGQEGTSCQGLNNLYKVSRKNKATISTRKKF